LYVVQTTGTYPPLLGWLVDGKSQSISYLATFFQLLH